MAYPALQAVFPEEVFKKAENQGFSKLRVQHFYRKFFYHSVSVTPETRGVNARMAEFFHTHYTFPTLKIVYYKNDSEGNAKIGYETQDGHRIEAVILKRYNQISLCISTQIGCKMSCAFCATGTQGYTRDLETWELVEQVRLAQIHYMTEKHAFTHITIMGMGEPMENFEAMYQAFLNLTHPLVYSIAYRKITVASCGFLPGLKKLAAKKLKPSLVLSLHAPNQALREKLLPISKIYPLDQLLAFIKAYPLKPNKRISVQYLLLKGINDQPEHAAELATLMKGMPVKINFMRYNIVEGLPFEPVDEGVRSYFIDTLRQVGISSIVRHSAGGEINAACGQLGYKKIQEALCVES